MDCNPPGSSACGILQARILEGVAVGSPTGNLPHQGIEPKSLMSPALAGRFFTTSTSWEALTHNRHPQQECKVCAFSPSNGLLLSFSGSELCRLWICHCFPTQERQNILEALPTHPTPSHLIVSRFPPDWVSCVSAEKGRPCGPPLVSVDWSRGGSLWGGRDRTGQCWAWLIRHSLRCYVSQSCHIVVSPEYCLWENMVEVPHVDKKKQNGQSGLRNVHVFYIFIKLWIEQSWDRSVDTKLICLVILLLGDLFA